MSKDRDRTVYRRPDGTWVNKRNDSGRASSLHDTQKEAIGAGRRMLQNQGGGELTTKGCDRFPPITHAAFRLLGSSLPLTAWVAGLGLAAR
jgi:Uncharacterized protein conserved in bacteria (DUF2188)